VELRVYIGRSALSAVFGLAGVAFLTGGSTNGLAGAWTYEAGHGVAMVTSTFSRAERGFDGSRDLASIPRYDKFEFQALFEYGVTDRFTALVMPTLQHIAIASPIDAERTGFGYTEFGGRYRLHHGADWVLSAQATARIPGTLDRTNPAAIGYTGMEFDLRLLFGHAFAFGSWPAYIDVQLAQRFREGGPPNEFRADLTFGVRPHPDWLLLAQVFNVISEGAKPPLFPSYDYSKVQLSAVYALTTKWLLQAGGFTTLNGRNALQENALLLGAWYKF
jgi:hypothetical protein